MKINYSRSTGFEWTPQNGGRVELINALWSYDQESLERMNIARKIRNTFAHEGKVSPNEVQGFGRVLTDYINFIESGQL